MKAYALLNIIIINFFFTGNSEAAVIHSSINTAKPLLVVLLMVKDEAEAIVPTLETYLTKNIKDGLLDDEEVAYFIYDTGSTDGTEQKSQDLFERKGIKNFHIEKESFVDFSTSRNRGLELVEKIFPQSTFILFVDAEWYLNDFDSLLGYCRKRKNDNPLVFRCYNLRIIDKRPYSFPSGRLLRQESKVRFTRRVHEIPDAYPAANLPQDIFVNYEPKKSGWERSQKRWLRDKEWLLEDLEKDPQDRRTLYLLGQTYGCLQDWDHACKYYGMVAEIDVLDEFTYLAYYNLGEITEYVLSLSDKQNERDWCLPMHYYLKAYSLRPFRAEPLIKIANHYLNTNEMALSYLYAHRAFKMAYPMYESLFVEKGMYDFDRYKILAISAWHVGDYKNGEKAARYALNAKPGDKACEYDLSCYENRKKNLQCSPIQYEAPPL